MEIPSKYLNDAVEQFASLPSIGKRSALRLVLSLLKRNPDEIERFANVIQDLKDKINYCSRCGNISDLAICNICANANRDQHTICIVEDVRDIMAIEATGSFRGVYHVLGGVISPMDGIGPSDLNISSLIERIQNERIEELIFALSSTLEGDTTNFYIYKKISSFNLLITTLSRGVAQGSELHYADELTLGRSIIQRLPFETTLKK